MKLTYWKCACLDDADCYSLRRRTRREAKAARAERHDADCYSQPFKVEIEYDSAFDLVDRCLTEGGAERPTPDEALAGTFYARTA